MYIGCSAQSCTQTMTMTKIYSDTSNPAKTEAQRSPSTLRAAGAPHRRSCATAPGGCRDSDLVIGGATHHGVPWRNVLRNRKIIHRWGGSTQVGSPINKMLVVLKCLGLNTLDSRNLAQLRQIRMTSLRLAAKNPACTRD